MENEILKWRMGGILPARNGRKMNQIQQRLFELQDLKYRDFNAKLIPDTDKETVIGVRAPQVKSLAKEMIKDGTWQEFVTQLPHKYHEENVLHGYIIGHRKTDIETVLQELDRFLPYVENWAVCDIISPKIFGKYPERIYEKVKEWISSKHTYTVRFGVVTLMQFFLDEHFRPEMLELAAGIHREEYYINMAIAWYFSTALAKQYEITLPLMESRTLMPWIQNKSIQKAVESYRVSDERKTYLRTLKVAVKKNGRG